MKFWNLKNFTKKLKWNKRLTESIKKRISSYSAETEYGILRNFLNLKWNFKMTQMGTSVQHNKWEQRWTKTLVQINKNDILKLQLQLKLSLVD